MMMRTRRSLALIFGVACCLVAGVVPASAGPLATYKLGQGWATFGLALPQGAAPQSVAVGTLPTQTDIKTRWPDGSIRFVVVTTRVDTAGEYVIASAAGGAGRLRAQWPSASVQMVIGPGTWTAQLPAELAAGWLDGQWAVEGRAIVAPRMRDLEHPFFRVIYDVRAYADGVARLDVTIENTLDHPLAADVTYDAQISLNGQPVFTRTGVHHDYLARWRHVSWSRPAEATVTPDFAPFIAARALPEYLNSVEDRPRSLSGDLFDILKTGDLMVPMNAHGGRPEIAPYPDWTAQYLVHKRADQRAYVLRHGELAGSFGVHIKEPDGVRMISIDEHPNFWLDGRADADGRPKNAQLRGMAVAGDNAHQPSLAFVPYLVTGDHFFLDEMKYWANYSLLSTFQDSYSKQRGGSDGLLAPNEVRGIAWTLRNLADAAAYTPDNDDMKAYFRAKVMNNLAWLDSHAASQATPLGTLFPGRRPEDEQWPPYSWIALWEHIYVAWAVDRAHQHGFGPAGTALRDRVVKLQLRLFTSEAEGYKASYAGAYVLAVGTRSGQGIKYFDTIGEMFSVTDKLGNYRQFEGYYGPEARLMLMIAVRQGLPGAAAAYESLNSHSGTDGVSMKADLARRSGWALAMEPQPAPARRRE
jgi:hypothetical protein